MKNRLNFTHFIEVSRIDGIIKSDIFHKSKWDSCYCDMNYKSYKTIALWKVKFKQSIDPIMLKDGFYKLDINL